MAAPLTSAGSRNTPIIVTLQRYLKEMADNLTSGPGLLRYAKRKGLIPAVRPLVEALLEKNFWISPQLVERALSEIGEGARP